MNKDESINLYGKKVKVKYIGSHFDRNRVREHYHLLYDEAEVYHIEDAKTKEIVRAFPSSSWTEAFEHAIMLLDIEKLKSWTRGPLNGLMYDVIRLLTKIDATEKKYLPSSEKTEIESLLWSVFDIIKFNDEENRKDIKK